MGSLTGCVKKAGAALRADDKNAVLARFNALTEGGTTATEAARLAVDEQIAAVRALIAAEQGGERAAIVTPGPAPKVYKTRAGAEAAKNGNTQRLRKVDGGYILRDATDKELAAAEKAGRRLASGGGVDVDRDPLLTAIAKLGGLNMRERSDTIGEGNKNIGGKMLFQLRGGALDDMARGALREFGYVPSYEVERDGGVRWLRDAIKAEFMGTQQHFSEQGTGWLEDRVSNAVMTDEEIEAAREAYAEEETARLDDWTADDLADAGYTGAAPDVQALTEQLIAEAEALGIDTETIRDDAVRMTEGESADAYHQATQSAIRAAIGKARSDAQGRNAGAAGASSQDRGEPDGEAGQEGLTLTAPTRAQVLAQQAALEQERADRDSPADTPRSRLTGEQVDIFNPQGSVFDAPAEAKDPRADGAKAAREGKPRDPPESLDNFSRQAWRAGWDAAKKAPGPTPQLPTDRQMASFIGIAANSIEKLRASDVDRVISETPTIYRVAVAQHIRAKRPDLAQDVADSLEDQPTATPDGATKSAAEPAAPAAPSDDPAEFPKDEAVRSYDGISHMGGSRAKSDYEDYENNIRQEREAAEPFATTDAQREAMAAAEKRLRIDYLSQYRRVMRVRANTYSAFVAGRSGLNSRQATSRNSALDKAQEQFGQWLKDNTGRIKAAVLNARSPEQLAEEQQAADAKRAASRAKDAVFIGKVLAFKTGDDLRFGATVVVKVNKDRDGYPSSLTVKDAGGAVLSDDKIDLVRVLYRGDKDKFRTIVDEVRAATPAAAEPSKTPTVDAHLELFKAVRAGTATPEDFKAMYGRVRDGKDAIVAELNTSTKDELMKGITGMLRPGTPKTELVEAIYKGLLRRFTLGKDVGPSSYMMGQEKAYEKAKQDAMDALVEGQTAESLAEYAKAAKAEFEAEMARRSALAESIKNPKTLDEYRRFMSFHTRDGKSTTEVRLSMLTPEQRAEFDLMLAEESRGKRTSAKDEQRTAVRVAGQVVDGEIVATKHTRDGHDLFVVRLAERVSSEDYQTLLSGAKRIGGTYSSFRGNGAVPGFQFRTREQAQAFKTLAGGDNTAAVAAAQERRDAFADDRSQTAAERLTEMADKMEGDATESLSLERKANTARRARFAASAEAGARNLQAMAKTMRNVAGALTSGKAKFLDRIRTRTQVELLQTYVANAQGDQLRAKYPTYAEQEKHKGGPPDAETADYAEFPTFTAYRSDLASLGRQLLEVDGTKIFGQRLMKVADDVSDAFNDFAKEPGNLFKLSTFSIRTGDDVRTAIFTDRESAERAIKRSGLSGKAIVFQERRRVNRIIMSPSEAMARGIWKGDGDKRITLDGDFGTELVEKMGRAAKRGAKVNDRLNAPWQFERAYERRKQLARMGLETPAEFRSALREFIGLREQAAEADRVKAMERAMVGRAKDGLDFFPTPEGTADEMVAAADIQPGMRVLEPSAGMGHIAERIRAAGVEPDVGEFGNDRRELLTAKGFDVVAQDFLQLERPDAPTVTRDELVGIEQFREAVRGDVLSSVRSALSLFDTGDHSGAALLMGRATRQAEFNEPARVKFGDIVQRLEESAGGKYDRILMNPPFSEGRDIQHVRHAYDLLKPGGRLVALMGESAFTNQNKRATEFREWLESVGGTEEKLPEGTFNDPSLPVNTGANARMVVIEKPAQASGTDAPAFSRADTSTGQPAASVQRTVDRIKAKWRNAPEVIVVESMQDERVPKAARDEDARQLSQGATGSPEGFIYGGKVYLIADQLADDAAVQRVLFHESLGHFGLRGMYGQELGTILDRMAILNAGKVRAKAKQYGLSYENRAQRRQAAEEVLAEMAQTNQQLGWVQRAIAAVRSWLRDNVPGLNAMKLSDAEVIANWILPARRFVQQGRAGVARNVDAVPAFGRADQTQTDAFKRWFGDSKVVDAEGKPLVVYHGTHADVTSLSSQADRGVGVQAGIYFAQDAGLANAHSYGVAVYPVHLSIKNPLDLTASYRFDTLKARMASLIMPRLAAAARKEQSLREQTVQASISAKERDELIAAGFDGIKGRDGVWIAFRPEQIKSAIGNRGTFDPSSDRVDFSRSIGAALTEGKDRAFDVAGKTGGALEHYRGMAMQLLGRRQIIDLWAKDIPALTQYGAFVERMDAEKNDTAAEADEVATEWGKLPDEGPLADLMHDATLARIDADPKTAINPEDDPAQVERLRKAFKALTPDAQATYRKARDTYTAHHQKVRQAIRERIERSELSSERRRKLLERMDGEFFKKVQGVYFPLARFGSYVVVVRDAAGEAVNVTRAETVNEAEAARAELRKAFPADKGFQVGKVLKDKEFNAARDGVGRGFMAELFEALDKQGADESLQDTVAQLYLAALPDLSWAKHGIHRKGTAGFSQDARRAFAQNVFHGGRYLAKLRYADRLQSEIGRMQNQVDERAADEGFDSIKAQQVVDEMVKRHELLMNPLTNPVSTALTSFGFIFHLGLSPASAMVNLSQTALVAFPQMAAKWGYGKTSAALMKASREAAGNRNDISKALTGDELAAYEEAVRVGAIDVTQAHDLAGISQGEDAKVTWKMRPVMKWASFMFHHAERFNRQVTFMAAYRLAREAGAAHPQAIEQATKSTYEGHFDYSSSNRPRLMQGNVAKVVLLFKQFGQNMIYTISRQAYLSMKGETPEVRAESRKALGGLLAMHAAAAGGLGLPMVSTLLAAASMLGGSEDEPWDAEAALKNMLADSFGKKAAEVMAHGLSRLTPWDISGRVALDRLILPDTMEGLEGARAAEAWMTAALGPVAGIAVSVRKGLDEISKGQIARGLETMAPSALRGPLRAMRFGDEGVVDKTGIQIVDEVSPLGIAGQALGLAASEVRQATEGKSAIYRQDRLLQERRAALMRQYAQAFMAGDAEGTLEAREDVRAFNAKNPTRQIKPQNLRASVAARRRRIEQADQGVYLPKNRRDAMEAGAFAAPG